MRKRTIKEYIRENKEFDPHSAITEYAIRTLVKTGEISHIRRGKKIIIDYEEVQDYFNRKNKATSTYPASNDTYYNSSTENRRRTSRF